jgi:hypothetical protein
MKAVLYILRFHGFGLTVSLTVLGFGEYGACLHTCRQCPASAT